MSVFRTSQSSDYPFFLINAQIGTDATDLTAGFTYGIVRYPAYPDASETPAMANAETALLAGIKTAFQNRDWTADYGAGVSLQHFTVTRYDESQSDVSPA